MALLLPAVQKSRSSARKLQCKNHLKQIVTAFHNHSESHEYFPSALIDGEHWQFQILPYLELAKPDVGPAGEMVGRIRAPVYGCPSDVYARGSLSNGDLSYVVSNGHGNHRRNGFYAKMPFQPIRPADVTDGLSATVALSERMVVPDPVTSAMTEFDDPLWEHRLVFTTNSFIRNYNDFADECETHPIPPRQRILVENSFNHIQSPNRKSCTNGPDSNSRYSDFMAITATSQHVGGVNVAFGDGSVRFVNENIDRNIWRAVGTRNGREVIELDFR